MTLGQRVKERRQALGVTQRDLAKAVHTAVQYISAIEQDKRIPSVPVLVKLSEQLGSSLDYLVFGKKISSDIIAAVKTDDSLDERMKKSLINLVKVMRESGNKP